MNPTGKHPFTPSIQVGFNPYPQEVPQLRVTWGNTCCGQTLEANDPALQAALGYMRIQPWPPGRAV